MARTRPAWAGVPFSFLLVAFVNTGCDYAEVEEDPEGPVTVHVVDLFTYELTALTESHTTVPTAHTATSVNTWMKECFVEMRHQPMSYGVKHLVGIDAAGNSIRLGELFWFYEIPDGHVISNWQELYDNRERFLQMADPGLGLNMFYTLKITFGFEGAIDATTAGTAWPPWNPEFESNMGVARGEHEGGLVYVQAHELGHELNLEDDTVFQGNLMNAGSIDDELTGFESGGTEPYFGSQCQIARDYGKNQVYFKGETYQLVP